MSENTPVPVGVPQTPTKALIAGVVSFLSLLVAGISAAHPDNLSEWVTVVLGALAGSLVTGGTTYKVPNKAKAVEARRGQDWERNERGESWVVIGLVVAVVIIATVLLLRGCDGKDNDGKKGQDWERNPVAASHL